MYSLSEKIILQDLDNEFLVESNELIIIDPYVGSEIISAPTKKNFITLKVKNGKWKSSAITHRKSGRILQLFVYELKYNMNDLIMDDTFIDKFKYFGKILATTNYLCVYDKVSFFEQTKNEIQNQDDIWTFFGRCKRNIDLNFIKAANCPKGVAVYSLCIKDGMNVYAYYDNDGNISCINLDLEIYKNNERLDK